jgi:pimeloyl-ACP methyl ester carboxylesterase
MPKAAAAGIELYYERAGSGEPLLAIQGMSGAHVAWGTPFRSALEGNFDCVAFDNRGVGLSAAVTAPFTIAEMAADAAAQLDALEIESAHVLGISMGGMIAQELALADPGRIRSLRRAPLPPSRRTRRSSTPRRGSRGRG